MPKYEDIGDSFNMSGVKVKLTPGELIKLKIEALNYAYKFLSDSNSKHFKNMDVLKLADTVVGWGTLIDDKGDIK